MTISAGPDLSALRAVARGGALKTANEMFAADPKRFDRYHVAFGDLLFDYSKHRIDDAVLALLFDLARKAGVEARRDRMFAGDPVNATERRPALHVALRNLSGAPIMVEGRDVMPDVVAERNRVAGFARGIRDGTMPAPPDVASPTS